MPRIAYLGPKGTFTEAALIQMVDSGMVPVTAHRATSTPVPTDSTVAALAAVRSGDADYACVPIENSIEGSVLPTLDSLATGAELQIFAELTLDVAFTIVVRPGIERGRRADRRRVPGGRRAGAPAGWPTNLPTAQLVPANSNAAAAQDVADGRADAGVSTALAAERYGPDRAGVRRRRRTQRPDPVRAGRTAGAAAADAPVPTGRRWCCGSTTSPARWCRR